MAKVGRWSTSWKQGISGNPSGRPKRLATVEALKVIAGVKTAARALRPQTLSTLEMVMGDPKAPPPARVAASVAVLDRGWGKPTQAVEATHDLTFAEIVERSLKIKHLEPPAYLGVITTPEMLRRESQARTEDGPGADNRGWEG